MPSRGHLDAITAAGYVEGWAFNEADVLAPLLVAVRFRDQEVARGLACRFRADLAAAGYGAGWCAFRLKLSVAPAIIQSAPLILADAASNQVLHANAVLRRIDDAEPSLTSIAAIIDHDPTRLGSFDRLKGCGELLRQFIKRRGVEEFVLAAYVYVLGRPGDAGGIESYCRQLKQNLLDPLDLLRILADCEEFRRQTRSLSAPCSPSFPFRLV